MRLYYWDKYNPSRDAASVSDKRCWCLADIPAGETVFTVRRLLRKRGYCTALEFETSLIKAIRKVLLEGLCQAIF